MNRVGYWMGGKVLREREKERYVLADKIQKEGGGVLSRLKRERKEDKGYV